MIVIVMHDFSLGGTERIAIRLAKAWCHHGEAVTIFCGDTRGPLASMVDPGVQVVAAQPAIVRSPLSRVRLGNALRRYLIQHPAAVCFIPGNYHWLVASVLGRRDPGGPKLVVQVSNALKKQQRRRVRQALFEMGVRWMLRRADAIVTLTEDVSDQVNQILRRPIATTISLPALDDDTPKPVPFQNGLPVVLAAGRLVPQKDFSTLLLAFSYLKPDMARLVILGVGPLEAQLRQQAINLGIADRVTLGGAVRDIRPALDAARMFVLSSVAEGFPAVIVEALAAGRPVVSTNCTQACRLLSDSKVGLVVRVRDAPAIANAIAKLISMPLPDPLDLAKRVEDHRIGSIAKQYLTLFYQVAKQPGII